MKITAAIWALLPAATQTQFTQSATNADEYDNGEENAGTLKNALEMEKAAKVKAAQERDALLAGQETALAKAKADALKEAREKGDFAAIEADYKKQLADANKRATEAAQATERATIAAHKETVLAELLPSFVSAKAGRAVLESMFRVELVDGKPMPRFLDGSGNPTALDAKGFKENLLTDPDLKGILIASKGSGGGATFSTGGGGATTGEKPKDMSNAKPADMVAYLESKGIGKAEG